MGTVLVNVLQKSKTNRIYVSYLLIYHKIGFLELWRLSPTSAVSKEETQEGGWHDLAQCEGVKTRETDMMFKFSSEFKDQRRQGGRGSSKSLGHSLEAENQNPSSVWGRRR